ncbi:MAG: UMP kinase [Clostridia bacterium]|nr:UMP kinase [Clostridia bacterium]
MQPKYKRILLKLSGEALAAGKTEGVINEEFVGKVAAVVARCLRDGVEVSVIVGAGNIWRGRQGVGMDRTRGDYMGMLATAINALAISDVFLRAGIDTRVMCAIQMPEIGEYYTRDAARRHLAEGRVVIFACGLGRPYFSTDTAGALRAIEIDADAILMAKNIDGVYTADPKLDPTAVKLDRVSYSDILAKDLRVIDLTSAALCKDNHIPTLVFGLDDAENIYRAVSGEPLGTLITE